MVAATFTLSVSDETSMWAPARMTRCCLAKSQTLGLPDATSEAMAADDKVDVRTPIGLLLELLLQRHGAADHHAAIQGRARRSLLLIFEEGRADQMQCRRGGEGLDLQVLAVPADTTRSRVQLLPAEKACGVDRDRLDSLESVVIHYLRKEPSDGIDALAKDLIVGPVALDL